MGKIYVIRHGQYTGSGRDEALTSYGLAQAQEAGARLSEEPAEGWQLLGSKSPRAVQTSAAIGGLIHATPVVSELISRAGEEPEDAAAFEARLVAALAEGGVEYDDKLSLAVVGHLPLLCCIAGSPEAHVANGEIIEYSPQAWDGSAGEFN
jgi:broad specificity phosphatase PhoE